MGSLQKQDHGHDVQSDTIAEVVAPVSGVVIKVRGSQHQDFEFELLVADLDSGLTFKEIKSNDLSDLLTRQHKLLLGFAI